MRLLSGHVPVEMSGWLNCCPPLESLHLLYYAARKHAAGVNCSCQRPAANASLWLGARDRRHVLQALRGRTEWTAREVTHLTGWMEHTLRGHATRQVRRAHGCGCSLRAYAFTFAFRKRSTTCRWHEMVRLDVSKRGARLHDPIRLLSLRSSYATSLRQVAHLTIAPGASMCPVRSRLNAVSTALCAFMLACAYLLVHALVCLVIMLGRG